MQVRKKSLSLGLTVACAAVLTGVALLVAGCTSNLAGSSVGTTVNAATATVPMVVTDAPSDQLVAASLTLNSIVLTDSTGATASVLSTPETFEATHLDAVQEPLFSPAIPEDTYTSVTLTSANPVVYYVDTTTKQVVEATSTLANTTQTITFATPLVVNKTTTSLLVDYLVANSVALSGSTATVTPAFHVTIAPISAQPTNGTNGLLCGVKGKITALGTSSFTITDGKGISMTLAVNSSTLFQNLTSFSDLEVGMLVEADIQIQSDGSLLAVRVDEEAAPKAAMQLLVGHVTSVTGSPATSFTELVHQNVGGASTTTSSVVTDTITLNSSTVFELPGRFTKLSGGVAPFAAVFSASTIFAGQSVSVATTGVTSNAATAVKVRLNPQTVHGTIASINTTGGNTVYTLTLPSGHWLATLTGLSTVTVYANGNQQAINSTSPAVGSNIRFNGFLFNVGGKLILLADVQADPPGSPIAPVI